MATATSTLSRNSLVRAGSDSTPRSPAAMSPAKKFNPTSLTPSSRTDRTNRSTSDSAGTAVADGPQNSTAPHPAALAAGRRADRGKLGDRDERVTAEPKR